MSKTQRAGVYLNDSDPRYVYTFWSGDECLYVGCTGYLGGRLNAHASARPWWPSVTSIDATVHPNRQEGERAERDRIRELQPTHNRVYTNHLTPPRTPTPEEAAQIRLNRSLGQQRWRARPRAG